MLRRDELVLASIVEAYSSLVCVDSRNGLDGLSRLPTDKRDHQARCASSAARTGATSPTCGATTIAARPRRHIHHLKSARSAANRGLRKPAGMPHVS